MGCSQCDTKLMFSPFFRRWKVVAIILLFSFTFTSCKLLKQTAAKAKALTQCRFDVVNVKQKVTLRENTRNFWNYVITINIDATNPTIEKINLGGYALDLYADGKWVGVIKTPVNIALTPTAVTHIPIKTVIAPNGAMSIIWKKLWNKKIQYRIKGTFTVKLGPAVLAIPMDVAKFSD